MSERTIGTVKWFDDPKGYGFLLNQDGEDVFVHYRSILGDEEFKTLAEGQQVEFLQVQSAKGFRAAEVEVL